MVERVAKVLRGYIHEDREVPGAIDAAARAVIEAMREPTDAMLEQCDQYGEGCYRAMIDAALS